MALRTGAFGAAVLLTGSLLAAACGGGDDDWGSVASLEDSGSSGSGDGSTDTTLSDAEIEDALVAWTECMRGEGVDIPDPTVDADGNLVLGRGGLAAGEGDAAARPDREEMQAARDVCGDPPQGAFGSFDEEDRAQFQENALAFAECMRDQGIADFPDPDLSNVGPGGGGGGTGDNADDGGTPGDGGGPFGDVDMEDPEVQAASEACQAELGDIGPGGGRNNDDAAGAGA